MKIKDFHLFVLIIFFVISLGSCVNKEASKDSCGGGVPPPAYMNVETIDFSLSANERVNDPAFCSAQPGSPSNPCMASYRGGYVNSSDLLLQVFPQTVRVQLNNPETSPADFSFFSSAYACSPAIINQTHQEIIGLSVKSHNNFNASFPSNTNLVPLMEVMNSGNLNIPLSTYITQTNKAFLLQGTTIVLNASPTAASKHVLTFLVTLGDSTQFTFKSDTLKIN